MNETYREELEGLEDRYRGLCAILLFLALTEEIGDEVRHGIAVREAEAGIKAVCEEIEELKRKGVADV